MDPHAEIRALLQTFQDGYTRRDVTQTDDFMELFTSDAEVIGTNGVRPGVDEWYMERASAREQKPHGTACSLSLRNALLFGTWGGWFKATRLDHACAIPSPP